MGQALRELTPLDSALHFFGAELRHWRTARGLSQAALGQLTHDSGSLIGKIEKAERLPSHAFARRLDKVLDTGGVLERLWPQVEAERATCGTFGRSPSGDDEYDVGDLGLGWSPTPRGTVAVVGALWRSELERRQVLASAAWVASAFAGPTSEPFRVTGCRVV